MPDATPARPASAPDRRDEPWTTKRLLDWMAGAFRDRGLDSPRLLAEMLIAHVLGCERLDLYTRFDRPAEPAELDDLRGLARRALAHEPVQYLVGESWFFSLPFAVDRRVLIPRPATETILEHLLQHARATPGFEAPVLADVCTGSGCVAIAALKNLPDARATAADVSPDALDVARANADRHGVAERIEFRLGELLEPLSDRTDLHYLVANPPYISDDEWTDVEPNVKDHEPHLALRAGHDPLALTRPILDRGPAHLRPGGLLLIETAAFAADELLRAARQHPELTDPKILDDFEGHPRVLCAARR